MKALFLIMLLALTPLNAAEPVRNFPLVAQTGKPFQLHDLKGNYVFITFIFSRCPMPKMCPLTMSLSNQLIRKWKATKSAPPLRVLAVTLDPDFDTAQVLKKFGESHRVDFAHFTLATGNPQALADLASEFNVMGFPGGGTIAHNMKNILLGPDLVEIKQYKENEWTADEVLQELKKPLPEKLSKRPKRG